MKALKLSKKMKYLKSFIALQWTMHNISKIMLGFQEDTHRKTNSLTHHKDATYQDTHNINTEGRPTEKPFVKSSLRIKPLVTSSSTLKNNKRVVDVHTTSV